MLMKINDVLNYKIGIVGLGVLGSAIAECFVNKKINIKVISTSEIKISVLIDKKSIKKALVALHDEFKLNK